MVRQFLAIPAASATAERVFSFAGLTLSDLHKPLLEGTLEVCGYTTPTSVYIYTYIHSYTYTYIHTYIQINVRKADA